MPSNSIYGPCKSYDIKPFRRLKGFETGESHPSGISYYKLLDHQ